MKRPTTVALNAAQLLILLFAFLGSSISVRALPMVAASSLSIDRFMVGANPVADAVTILSNSASFDGFGSITKTDERDAIQAKSGPGPFPNENHFAFVGGPGQFARSDSRMGPFDIDNLPERANLIAQARRESLGAASGSASGFLFLDYRQFDTPLKFSFDAFPLMGVQTTAEHEVAVASIYFKVELWATKEGGKPIEVLVWEPCGDVANCFKLLVDNMGAVSDVNDPFSLNTSISCRKIPCTEFYDPSLPPGAEFSLSFDGGYNTHYLLLVDFGSRAVVYVAEPATLALVCVALLGLPARTAGRRQVNRHRCEEKFRSA